MSTRWHLAILLIVIAPSLAQPPWRSSEWLVGNDLPGMPIAITETNGDGQFCAFACNANAACRGYSYAPAGCNVNGSTSQSGLCWLKTSASSANSTTAPCPNSGSFIMRPDPASIPPIPSPASLPVGVKNVLYVLVDDMRPEAVPFGDAPFTFTPNLAALTAQSTFFNRTYANIAVCSPSRNSFLTGRYPHHTLAWNFINHFRQATCQEVPNTAVDGGTAGPYQLIRETDGGAGQCCSFCTADAACTAWTFNQSGSVGGPGHCALYNVSSPVSFINASGSSHPVFSGYGNASLLMRNNWTSLPQHFTNSGYLAMSTGKVFHSGAGGNGPAPWDGPGAGAPPLQDPPSWSRGNFSMHTIDALAPMRNCTSPDQNASSPCSVDSADAEGNVPDGVFQFEDRIISDDALLKLNYGADNYALTGQPFFLAVGFRKPHLPFRHPGPYDDYYPPLDQIPLAQHTTMDASVPPIAFHTTAIAVDPYNPIPDAQAQQLRRDYYACISWIDWNLGRVLDQLDALGLRNETAVVFHSDHGWSLGEHGEWEKFTNWEHGTRVPLLIRAPWIENSAGQRSNTVSELVDVYPTIAELAGIPVPQEYELDGSSLVPVLESYANSASDGDGDRDAAAAAETDLSSASDVAVRRILQSAALGDYALSVYPRCPADLANTSMYWNNNDCLYVERTTIPFMGVSLRTSDWRYTEWLPWNGTALSPVLNATTATVDGSSVSSSYDGAVVLQPAGIELYTHIGDDSTTFDGPWEQVNLAGDPQYAPIQSTLAQLLRQVYPAGSSWPGR